MNPRNSPVLIRFGCLVLGLWLCGCDLLAQYDPFTRKADRDPVKAKQAREERQQVVADIAVAPLPTGVPLVERDGKDVWGYPRSYVDGAGLRSLLLHDRYTELTQAFEHFQREFENDPSKEYWPVQATEAFFSAEPELLPKLDAWMAKMPFSFAPYLSRGAYRAAVAWANRGSKWAKDTPTSDMEAMMSTARLARKDLERALEIAPKLAVADRVLMDVALPTGDREMITSAFTHGKTVCPSCLSIYTKYLGTLKPRWGGSYDAMEHFIRTQAKPDYPNLKPLKAFIDMDRADSALGNDKLDEKVRLATALEHANDACAVGDFGDCFAQRAEVYASMKDYPKALADIERAVELLPAKAAHRMARAEYRSHLKDWEGAAADLIAVIQVTPTDHNARRWRPYIAKQLGDSGWAAHQAGDREKAIRQLELAEQLAPGDREIRKHKEQSVRGGVTGKPDEIAALQAKAQANPDDFRAHQQLDYAWAKKRQFDKVIAMWTEYLQRHPDNGQAYFERSGAYYNSGHKPEAFADVEKACGLGVSTACAYARRMPK